MEFVCTKTTILIFRNASIVSAGSRIWTSTQYASPCYRRRRRSSIGRYFLTMRRKHATCYWPVSFVGNCRNTACCALPCTRATCRHGHYEALVAVASHLRSSPTFRQKQGTSRSVRVYLTSNTIHSRKCFTCSEKLTDASLSWVHTTYEHGPWTPVSVFTGRVGHQCITGVNMGCVHGCSKMTPVFTGLSRAVFTARERG